jgi:hypothetical protein
LIEELIVGFVHDSEVVHRSDEDVDLDDVPQTAARRFEDHGQVAEHLPLFDSLTSPSGGKRAGLAHGTILGRPFYLLSRLGVDADVARAVDHAIVLGRLGELGQWFRGFGREDRFDLLGAGHVDDAAIACSSCMLEET